MGRKSRARRDGMRAVSSPQRPEERSLLYSLILISTITVAYSSSFQGVFLGDDLDAIVRNPNIRSLSLAAFSAPRDTTLAGRPIAAVSFAVSYALAPDDVKDAWEPANPERSVLADGEPMASNVRGYHAFNLAIHLAAALVLFGLVRRSLLAPALGPRFERFPGGLAFAVALIWAVHPLTTAAVTYIVQRAESLMGLFLLTTIYATVRVAESTRRRRLWIVVAVLACAMGMATKEVMVVAPLLAALWLHLLWPRAMRRRDIRVLLLGLAATWILLASLVATDPRAESVGFLGGWTPVTYLRTQGAVIVHYLVTAVSPKDLLFTHEWAPAESWFQVLPQLVFIGSLVAVTGVAVVRRKPIALLGGWFFLILAPSSSLLPIATEVAADHRMYLPLAAVVTAVVLAVHEGLQRSGWSGRDSAGTAALGILVATLGTPTYARNKDYWSLEAMMTDVIEKRPEHVKARVMLGGHLVGLERFAEAEPHLRVAASLPPSPSDPALSGMAHMYLGSALAAQGRAGDGIPHLEQALRLAPSLVEAYGLLGEAYASQGREVEASRAFRRAAEALPDIPPLLNRAARLLAASADADARDGAAAVGFAERAAELTGGRDLSVLDTLAAAYAESGRFPEAIAIVHRALDLARRSNNASAVAVFEERLIWYHAGRPLRDR